MIYLALSRFCRSSFAHFPIEHVALAGHHCKIRNNAIRSKTVTELFFSLIYNANGQRWAKRNLKRKAQLPQPPQLRKLRCALIFYFESLRKLRCGIKPFKFVAL